MRKTLRRSLTAAATLAMMMIGTSLVAATPASAQVNCPDDHICFYEHINFNQGQSGWRDPRHVATFSQCGALLLPEPYRNDVTSVYNNTDAHLTLWDLESSPSYLIGTAAKRKGYSYLGARGNDELDWITGVGCP